MQELNKEFFKIVQISDTHLFKENTFLDGVDTNSTFFEVVQRIKKVELEDTDAIFLTGDLSQDESKESYKIIVDALCSLKIPIFWIPGNHDSIELMQEIFVGDNFVKKKYFLR